MGWRLLAGLKLECACSGILDNRHSLNGVGPACRVEIFLPLHAACKIQCLNGVAPACRVEINCHSEQTVLLPSCLNGVGPACRVEIWNPKSLYYLSILSKWGGACL